MDSAEGVVADFEEVRWPGASGAPRLRDMRSGTYPRYRPDLLADRPLDLSPGVRTEALVVENRVRALTSRPGTGGLEGLSRFLLRSEAIASSQIEGLVVSPQRVGLAELRFMDEAPQGRPIDPAEEVAALMRALRQATTRLAGTERISSAQIVELQRVLLRHRPDLLGPRAEQNWIGGSDYHPMEAAFVPPAPELVPELMEDLAGYLNTGDHAPLIQAALVDAQFETIHPFADGNGRVGRALIHTVLVRRQLTRAPLLPVSAVLLTRADEYVAGLTAYRYSGPPGGEAARRGIDEWVSTFLGAASRSITAAERFALELDELRSEWDIAVATTRLARGLRGAPRAGSTTAAVLDLLPDSPALTPGTLADQIGVSRVAAANALTELADAGVLSINKLPGGVRCYLARAVFNLLTDSERQLASTRGDTRARRPNRAVPHRPQ